ncbi:MAG: lysylphosphatidylglycerol synthase transmembrane domain-containing protein [Promethearchaeota archaeon]
MSESTSELPTLKKFFDFKTIIFLVLAFGGMLIYFILTTQEYGGISAIINTLLGAAPLFVFAGIVINFCALAIDVLAWRLILSTNGIQPRFLRLINVYLTSFVFGLLIPSAGAVEIGLRTSMGREFYNYKEQRNATSGEIFSSIALHRLLGTLAFIPLSIVVAAGLTILLEEYIEPWMGLVFVLVIVFFAVFLTCLIFSVYLRPQAVIRFFGSLPVLHNHKTTIQNVVNDYNTSLSHLGRHKGKAMLAFLCTFGTAIVSYIGGTLIIYSLDDSIPFLVVTVVIFLSGLLNLIPIPIPGMEGLREISVSWLFNVYKPGQPEKAAAASLLISLSGFYVVITVGILVYLVTRGSFLRKDFETLSNQKIETDSPID